MSNSIALTGYHLGYLHKQAEDRSITSKPLPTVWSEPEKFRPQEYDVPPYKAYERPGRLSLSGEPPTTEDIFGKGDRFGLDSLPAADDADPWDNLPPLSLPGLGTEKVDPTEEGKLQLATRRPVKTEGGDPILTNKEKILEIMREISPGAGIGGAVGLGASLAGDAVKGDGLRVGKAVGMTAGGAAIGALINALADRQKIQGTMSA